MKPENTNEYILDAYSKAERALMNLYFFTNKRKYEKAALRIAKEERKERTKYEN